MNLSHLILRIKMSLRVGIAAVVGIEGFGRLSIPIGVSVGIILIASVSRVTASVTCRKHMRIGGIGVSACSGGIVDELVVASVGMRLLVICHLGMFTSGRHPR